MDKKNDNLDFWDAFGRYAELRETPIEARSSWTDSLDDKWNAYIVDRTDTHEVIATVYREDLAYEFVKMLNDLGIPAWWSPDMCAGLRSEGRK